MAKTKFVKVSTRKSDLIGGLCLLVAIGAIVAIPNLPLSEGGKTFASLASGAAAIALLRSSRAAMVRWPEIDDQHLSAIERLAKFRLKILTFTATFIYAACAVDLISYRSENGVTNGVIFSVGAVSLAAGITLGRIYKRKFLVQV